MAARRSLTKERGASACTLDRATVGPPLATAQRTVSGVARTVLVSTCALSLASNKKEEYWYLDSENTLFTGDSDRLSDFVKDDVVLMNVTSLGSFSYDTQIGGNTTVPLFSIEKISHKGSCE